MKRSSRNAVRSLNYQQLRDFALRYVGRYATSCFKLSQYLKRKIGQAEWTDSREPDEAVTDIVEQFRELGYIDDAEWARQKARSLTARGYGPKRFGQEMHKGGIASDNQTEARNIIETSALANAITYARKRRFGPFAPSPPDPATRQKHLAAMMRAGHSFGTAQSVLNAVDEAALEYLEQENDSRYEAEDFGNA